MLFNERAQLRLQKSPCECACDASSCAWRDAGVVVAAVVVVVVVVVVVAVVAVAAAKVLVALHRLYQGPAASETNGPKCAGAHLTSSAALSYENVLFSPVLPPTLSSSHVPPSSSPAANSSRSTAILAQFTRRLSPLPTLALACGRGVS